jgi:SAM-dependent methyltransferase
MVAAKEFSIVEHDWQSQAYVDEWIKRDVQRDDERRPRLREMLSHAPAPGKDALSVLDVGGGFGVVTKELLGVLPHARVTLQDYSQPMLDHARDRLARHGNQITYVLADLCAPSWVGRVGGPFDLVVSSWAIHNLTDAGPIGVCYRGVESLLKPGSAFLNFDLVDHAGGVALHTSLLLDAGFARVECLWHQTPTAIIAAYSNVAG